MPHRTDDEALGLPWTYLGAPGVPLPAARIPAWGMFFGTTLVLAILVVLLAPGTGLRVVGLVLCPGLALLATRRVMPKVNYYTPFRYWKRLLLAELHTPRAMATDTPERETTLSPSIFK